MTNTTTHYESRQTIIKSQSDLIHGFYDAIHTPPSKLNNLLKKTHHTRVLTVRKLMSQRHHRIINNSKKLKHNILDTSTDIDE